MAELTDEEWERIRNGHATEEDGIKAVSIIDAHAALVAQLEELKGLVDWHTKEDAFLRAQVAEMTRERDEAGRRTRTELARVDAAEARVRELEAAHSTLVSQHATVANQLAAAERKAESWERGHDYAWELKVAAEARLAAANALLGEISESNNTGRSWRGAIRAHLAAQPATAPARDEAEQRVLEELDKCSAWRDGHGVPHVNDTREFAESELARREAKRG